MAAAAPEAHVSYDAEADVLYISLGPPQAAVCLEPEEGLVLRLDPETEQLVGVTVLGARRRLQSQPDWRPAPFASNPSLWETARQAASA